MARWLTGGCDGPAPVRQGFVAALVRPDGTVLAAASARTEATCFYAVIDGELRLAVHPRDLIAAMREPPALDVGWLADLAALWDDQAGSPFVGVSRLPLGHRLSWQPGRTAPTVVRWFDPDTRIDPEIGPASAVTRMRAEILAAVAASLPPDGDVHATLSGGLDSSLVTAVAAHELAGSGRALHALTHVPLPGTPQISANWEPDDSPYARRLCAELPGRVSWQPLINAERQSHYVLLPQLYDVGWLPMLNPSNLVWISAALRVADDAGSSLLLTGATGNGPFSRDAAGPLGELAAARRPDRIARYLRAALAAGVPLSQVVTPVRRAVVPEPLRAVRHRLRRHADQGSDAVLDTLPVRPDLVGPAARQHLDLMRVRTRRTRQDWIDFVLRDAVGLSATRLLGGKVWWSDPLSDEHVLRLALRLPPQAWLAGGRSRGLAREVGRGLVGDHIRLRTTRGGQALDRGQWLTGRLRELQEQAETVAASPAAQQFLDVDAVRRSLDTLDPSDRSVHSWEMGYGRALGFGLFAAWYESSVLAPARLART